jgi:NAD(P)-dependent dehydrogenase (short-subunit alcohol dehydrogenase family)
MKATVLVTGASSGFGAAIAEAFAARGDRVLGASRRPPALPGVEPLELDVTDPDSRTRALAEAGPVDVLVNNAGVLEVAAWEELEEAGLRRIFETNLFGPVALTRAVLPSMRRRGSGRVVNISAIGALLPTSFLGAYAASKHALDAFSASLDGEVRPFGIRSSSVLPGAFSTGILERAPDERTPDGPYAEAVRAYRKGLRGRLEEGGSDFAAVVEAVLAAAFDPDPRQRYLIASERMTHLLGPIVEQLGGLAR